MRRSIKYILFFILFYDEAQNLRHFLACILLAVAGCSVHKVHMVAWRVQDFVNWAKCCVLFSAPLFPFISFSLLCLVPSLPSSYALLYNPFHIIAVIFLPPPPYLVSEAKRLHGGRVSRIQFHGIHA